MSKPPLKILFKFPSRGRVERFFQSLDSIYNNLYDIENFTVLITLDADDKEMAKQAVFERIKQYPNNQTYYGISHSKIDAVNRDMPLVKEWDIVVVMSDDMKFSFYGFDALIREQFEQHGLDTLLHIPDQDAKSALATMYIAGRKFYDRFGYIYHPSYKSLWCDNEAQSVAKILGCYRYYDIPHVVTHLNPAYGHLPKDEMFIRQQLDWEHDEKNFYSRKAKNFDL